MQDTWYHPKYKLIVCSPHSLKIITHLLLSSSLQHPLILFLSATALAVPLGPEEVAAELPDSIQNSFYCHKLKISSGPNGSYFPSFISSNTEPLSSARTVCHCPAGTLTRKWDLQASDQWHRYKCAPTHRRTPPQIVRANTLPSLTYIYADEWVADSPAQWHSASAGFHLPENFADPNYNAGEKKPLPAQSNYPKLRL